MLASGNGLVGRPGLVALALLATVLHLVPAVAPLLAVLEGAAAGEAYFGGQIALNELLRNRHGTDK
jgi:hypothetical protein